MVFVLCKKIFFKNEKKEKSKKRERKYRIFRSENQFATKE